jgi:hypothetical protein
MGIAHTEITKRQSCGISSLHSFDLSVASMPVPTPVAVAITPVLVAVKAADYARATAVPETKPAPATPAAHNIQSNFFERGMLLQTRSGICANQCTTGSGKRLATFPYRRPTKRGIQQTPMRQCAPAPSPGR